MLFEPPRYQWEVDTAYDAEKILDAAQQLIAGHMATLAPDANGQWDAKRATPLGLKISLDLGPVVERINDKRTVDALAAELDETG